MKIARFLPALVVAAGCGGPAPREAPAAPPDNPGEVIRPIADPQDDRIVAFVDDQPVTWRAVVEHSMAARGKELIDKYLLWKLRKDRLEELGIKNSSDDLRKRAQLWIDDIRNRAGDAAVKKKLEEQKLTEKEYVERFVANPEFDEHVKTEKAIAYTLLTEPSIEIDTMAFTSELDAATFAAFAAKSPFPQAAEQLMLAGDVKGKIAHWPRYRFSRGLAPDAIASTPVLEQKLFGMKKGEVSGVERTTNGIILVATIVEKHTGTPAPYAQIADRVLAELLRQPPSEAQAGLWLERLFKSKRIRYEDRHSPRNQDR